MIRERQMALQEIHAWTLGSLIRAFIDLVLAYFLLCGSAFAFFASKLCIFFGLYLPCPCKGSFFGYRNSNFCLHKLLFEWPSRRICSIKVMAAERFPFNLGRMKSHSCNVYDKIVEDKTYDNNRLVELEDEASCSSCSGPHLLSLVDKENGYDAKGKRVINLKRKSGIRRRRRGNYDFGKFSLVVPSRNLQSEVASTSCLPRDGSISKDIEDAQTGHDLDEQTCHSYEFNGSMVDSPGRDKYSSSSENYLSDAQDDIQVVGNEENRIKMLENALEEEKAAYAALYLDLEKERAAAATSADEAIAMISRLQEEKASIEMEMRQYQRMIEERVNYDEEEMNILQDMLIRREMENHFLEKELEAYRKLDSRGNDQSNGKPKVMFDEWGQRPAISVERHEDPLQSVNNTMPIVEKDEISNSSSNYMVAQTCINTEVGEELEKNTQQKDQAHGNLHSSIYDAEPDVLDVHVIDENIELREEEDEKISCSSFSIDSNEPRNRYVDFGGNCPRTSKMVSDTSVDGSTSQLSTLSSARCKTLPFDSGSDPSRAVHNEKLKIDKEIEFLGERLRIVQLEKENLALFAENGENEKGRLKLLEEITDYRLQIKQLRNPLRGTSLPPLSAKVSLRKIRGEIASLETSESS
ncbi:PREDICTED: myosin-binding protein 2-like isoform X2 [Lupinus angustifolius]|uniref:myosin-binding protein 2-like isoform X2 n=1 Tax=Lupinus angustifolius TaxID=3871 RepID=UPI00092FBFFE|nr:PREDICTED: myosin-binding protein 2-like isoform X2 [Lupinus angustifolius]XP_019464615.1 PREDICTED: myosin-binding protein 2-like isoform X2 [Lupinus angustifolius]